MSIHNPKMSLENAAKSLDEAMANILLKKRKGKSFGKRFYTDQHQYQEINGDTPTGNVITATQKEIKVIQSQAEAEYSKRIKRYKGIGERPRLTHYKRITLNSEKPAKKLWEQ